MTQKPMWVVASLLTLLALLMSSHLSLVALATWECDSYTNRILDEFAHAQSGQSQMIPRLTSLSEECSQLDETLSALADQYLQTILALLGGAGVAGAAAVHGSSNNGNPKE